MASKRGRDVIEARVIHPGEWTVVVEGKGVICDTDNQGMARACYEQHCPGDDADEDAPCVYLFQNGKLVEFDDPDLDFADDEDDDEEEDEDGEEEEEE